LANLYWINFICLIKITNDDELGQVTVGAFAMTVPGSRIWASSSAIPQSQNTAPVLEFRCLYTPDLRRKQKRWQDGRLKYHTFNKRIMVYDDRSNFVGDSHWREDHTFGEGEEVELERCGILVEVSECVGTREQDLTSLLNKALKDRQETAKVRAVDFPPLGSRGSVMRAERVGPLHAESTERSAKRRKPIHSPPGKNGYAQNLTGVTLALSRTCSTPTPLRYDPEWLQTMKQPIEEIDMSSTAGLSQTPQGRPVAIRISGTNALSIQTRTTSKNSSSASVESGYAPNITGTALVLATKTLMSRRPLPGSGRVEEATSQSGGSGAQAITIEEDEFMDVDVYDKENLHVEKATAASFPAIELVKHSQKKSSPDLTSHQPLSEVYQPGRSSNPLRIKTLPKRKLFLAADPPSRPPSFNEPSGGIDSGATCPSASPRAGGAVRPPVIVSRVASITETRPLNMDEHRSSSPVSIELDHHGIDVLLTRKLFGKPSVAGELQGHQQPCNEINKTTQSAKESRNTVGSKGQRGTLSSLIPAPELELVQKNTQNQRQLSTLHSNRISEIEKAHVSVQIFISLLKFPTIPDDRNERWLYLLD
jgi:hypothetical protein